MSSSSTTKITSNSTLINRALRMYVRDSTNTGIVVNRSMEFFTGQWPQKILKGFFRGLSTYGVNMRNSGNGGPQKAKQNTRVEPLEYTDTQFYLPGIQIRASFMELPSNRLLYFMQCLPQFSLPRRYSFGSSRGGVCDEPKECLCGRLTPVKIVAKDTGQM